MSRTVIEAVLEFGRPFTVQTSDGREYRVPRRDYISLPPKGSFVVVYDDEERFWILPLSTITHVAYQDAFEDQTGESSKSV
jgi:hypothetical protein